MVALRGYEGTMTGHREVERKFDAHEGDALPDLTDVEAVAAVGAATDIDLRATYFDTADLRLARAGITLRRRTGGLDEGWHLKLPVGPEERTEMRLPLATSESVVPDQLQHEVRALLRGRMLGPVASLHTLRTERPLLAADGTVLATMADDTVRAQRFASGGGAATTWRELEVELVDGEPALLGDATRVLAAAGISRSSSPSKLRRALGEALDPPDADRRRPDRLGRDAPAGTVVVTYLRAQVEVLLAHDPGARHDAPDAVHQMRVASRRLRSALTTYRSLFDRTRTDPLRGELKWLGQTLGAARDAEVLWARLDQLQAALPPDLRFGPVASRIRSEMATTHRVAHDLLIDALDHDRYHALLDDLDALVDDPPFTERAGRRADHVIPRLVGHAARRVDRAAAAVDRIAEAEPTGTATRARSGRDERSMALHEVRKAAKQARYAAESAAASSGRPAERLGNRMEALQEVLGEHQDSVGAQQALRAIALAAHLAGENAFSYGVLHGQEQARGEAAQEGYRTALAAATKPKVRAWTEV